MNVDFMLMNQMLKMFGHTETLYILDTQFVDDLDVYRCLPLVTHHAKCNWSNDVTILPAYV